MSQEVLPGRTDSYLPPTIRYRKPHREAPLFLFIVLGALAIGGALYAVTLWQQRVQARHVSVILTWFDAAPRLRNDGDESWRPAFREMPLAEGSELRTERGRRTVISVEDVSSLRLGPYTTIRFESLRRDGNVFHARIRLLMGRLWLDCASRLHVVVDSDAGHFKTLGRACEVIVTRHDSTLRAWRGKAWYGGSLTTRPVTLPGSHELIVPMGSLPIARALAEDGADVWDRWNLHTSASDVADGIVQPERHFVALGPHPPRRMGWPPAARARRRKAAAGARAAGGAEVSVLTRQQGTAPPGSGYVNLPSFVPYPWRARGASNWREITPPSARVPVPGATPRPASARVAPRRPSAATSWIAPAGLSRKGLPDLSMAVGAGLPSVNTRSPEDARSAFDGVVSLFRERYHVSLRRPVVFKLISSDDFSVLKTHQTGYIYYYQTAQGISHARYHELWVIENLSAEDFLTTCAHFLGEFWYAENHPSAASKGSEQAGFGTWLEYKYLVLAGAPDRAQAFLQPDAVIDQSPGLTEAFHGVLALEKDYGEYGVLYFVTHGSPPEYEP